MMIRGARRLAAAVIHSAHHARAHHRDASGIVARAITPAVNASECGFLSSWISGYRNVTPYSTGFNNLRYFSAGGTAEEKDRTTVDSIPDDKQEMERKIAELARDTLPKHLDEGEEEVFFKASLRDSSDAEEFQERYARMVEVNDKLKRALALMGALQLISAWWIVGTYYKSHNLYFFLTGISATLSFQVAYILHSSFKPPPKNVDGGRLRLLTLPLWSVRSATGFMSRTYMMLIISVAGLGGALAFEVVPALSSQ